jgi:hypothetical protein
MIVFVRLRVDSKASCVARVGSEHTHTYLMAETRSDMGGFTCSGVEQDFKKVGQPVPRSFSFRELRAARYVSVSVAVSAWGQGAQLAIDLAQHLAREADQLSGRNLRPYRCVSNQCWQQIPRICVNGATGRMYWPNRSASSLVLRFDPNSRRHAIHARFSDNL